MQPILNPYAEIFMAEPRPCTPSQAALQSTLISLLQEKDLDSISTVELCSKSFVARSTFYAYYQSMGQVLEELEDDLIYSLLHLDWHDGQKDVDTQELAQFYSKSFDFVADKRQAFYTLLVANPNYRFIEKWKCAIKYLFWQRLFQDNEHDCSLDNSELVLEIGASVVVTALSYWLRNPHDVSPESIYSALSQLLRLIGYENSL